MANYKYKREPAVITDETEDTRLMDGMIREQLRQIKSDYPGLAVITAYLSPCAVSDSRSGRLDTDGQRVFYNPEEWREKIRGYRNSSWLTDQTKDAVKERLLHIIFHGLLGHFSDSAPREHKKSSRLARDLEVLRMEYLCDIEFQYFTLDGKISKRAESIKNFPGTGEAIYRLLKGSPEASLSAARILKPYRRDDHTCWDLPEKPERKKRRGKNAGNEGKGGTGNKKGIMVFWESQRKDLGLSGGGMTLDLLLLTPKNREKKDGEDRQRMLLALSGEVLKSEDYGSGSGGITRKVKQETEEVMDYGHLVEELSKVAEKSVEEDSLDAALYTYGLELYGDVPIVEPVDVTEDRHLNTIVIALDVSGSCEENAGRFLGETAAILEKIGEKASIDRLHLIACDDEITFEKEAESTEELKLDEEGTTLTGFGGTSFEPVFRRIEEYQEEGEKIDALIYYTDGCGSYPWKVPEYPVYFILPKEESYAYRNYVPDWIRTLLL